MTYDIDAARAERIAQRKATPFEFQFQGHTWTMKHADDLPASWLTWSPAGWVRNIASVVVEDGFPADQLTAPDIDALVAAWLGSTPGE